jgi:hypothetical protein
VVNSLPKAGTNLLMGCVTLMGGYQREDLFLNRDLVDTLRLSRVVEGTDGIALGISQPCWVATREVERLLLSLWAGEFVGGHLPHSQRFVRLLDRHGSRLLLVLRDPRDVVVSDVYYITSNREHRWHTYFTQVLRTPEERLRASIIGVDAGRAPGGEQFRNIGERLAMVQPWLGLNLCYTTRFEHLVGPQGGGSAEAQRTEIKNIAQHLGLSLSPEQVKMIASRLFGQVGATFRRGHIGAWREMFREEHRALFKGVAGRRLVELGYEQNHEW